MKLFHHTQLHKRFWLAMTAGLLSFALAASPAAPAQTVYADTKTASKEQAEWSITLYPNDGTGKSEVISAKKGADGIQLPANEFTREGYVFRGWATDRNRSVYEFEDQEVVKDKNIKSLYALWEPQLYIIHFDKGTGNYGEMDDMYAIYDKKTKLAPLHFSKKGYRFAGWKDSSGKIYQNKDTILNLDNGNTDSEKVITVDAGKPENTKYTFRSTQGSCVYEEDGVQYLVTAAGINDSAYNNGDLSHYETILTKYNLKTGKVVKAVRNLQFDHGNGICYNPDNGHLYIAEGGSYKGYPSGVMEVDENLNKVNEWDFPLLTKVYAITYEDHHFYVIGRSSESRNTLCTLTENMQTLSIKEVDQWYGDTLSSQGIGSDKNYIYAVGAGFKTYEWKSKQRISVFTHEGEYIGCWTLDIDNEAEDITVIDGYAYITTNEHAKSTLYKTKLPVITLTAQWKK